LHAAWHSAGPEETTPVLSQGQAGRLAAAAIMTVTAEPGAPVCLELALDPAALTVIANASTQAAHWLRLADASLKPLPTQPGLLVLARGDSYIALIGGETAPDPSMRMAAARFIHLRDYFNADKLAEALLLELQGGKVNPPRLGVLVVECR
jgi:hypothetical protein